MSVLHSQPVEVYKFEGTLTSYYMTSDARDVTMGGQVYTATPVSRGAIQGASEDQEDFAIEITMPYNHPLIAEYVFGIAPPDLEVEIWRGERDHMNSAILLWKGKPLSFAIEGLEAKLSVPSPLSYILNDVCPPKKYQGPCNHILYDQYCGVSEAGNTHTSEITALSGKFITLDSNPFVDQACRGGELVWTAGGQRRMISSHTGNVFKVATSFSGLSIGQTVTIKRGCNHSFAQCKDKFNNLINFGGFPIVPEKNPFKNSLGAGTPDAKKRPFEIFYKIKDG
jgi:uncharacterized phage protein (TIGR02218 family)